MSTGYNPFNPNSVVVPNLFAGRSTDVLKICRKLSQLKHAMPASFYIHGERGIGKTALAKLIKSVAIENDETLYGPDLLTSYYSVEEGQNFGSVLQESINGLTDQLDKSLVQEIGSKLGSLFENGKFTIGAFGANLGIEADAKSTGQAYDITVKDQSVSILRNLINALDGQNNKQGLLIIIDETHNLSDLGSAASIIRNIATTLDVDAVGRISFLLIGYSEDVTRFFSNDSSARRTFDLFQLDVMPDEEAIEILEKGFREASVTWNKQALNANIRAAGGYPHSIQLLGHNLIDVDRDDHIDQNDWSSALIATARQLASKEFTKMYAFNKQITEKDKVLRTLALKVPEKINRKELVKLVAVKNLSKELGSLKTLGAIKDDENKNISLHSQLFRTAILINSFVTNNEADIIVD